MKRFTVYILTALLVLPFLIDLQRLLPMLDLNAILIPLLLAAVLWIGWHIWSHLDDEPADYEFTGEIEEWQS